MEFVFLFLFRTVSGIQNGLGYALHGIQNERRAVALKTARFIVSCLLIGGALVPPLLYLQDFSHQLITWAFVACWISVVGAFGVEDSFSPSINILPNSVHLWEMLCTSGVVLAYVVLHGNLYLIAASVYPGLILHKGAINIGGGHRFFHHGTDDPTGDTFSLPLLGWKVPRAKLTTRLILAALSLIGAGLTYKLSWSITIYEIFAWIR